MSKLHGDEEGLFWKVEVTPLVKKGRGPTPPRVKPPVPSTGWKRPDNFPDLSSATRIAVDVESDDPNLLTLGPGWQRGDATIVGVAIGTDNGYRAYFPFGHDDSDNFRKEDVYPWLSAQLSRARQQKVGANLYYDIEALQVEGVKIEGPLRDVQVAEPLIDETRYEYNLESLSQEYLGVGKEEDDMVRWACRAFGCKPKDVKRYMKHIPAALVGPYAEGDVDRPLRILPLQEKKLLSMGMMPLFEMESQLTWPLLRMRQTGVRVDTAKVLVLEDEFNKRLKAANDALGNINTDASADIAKLFDKHGVEYPRTAKGNPSFRRTWLEHQENPICKKLMEARKYRTLLSTFVKGCLTDHNVNGRVHAQFNQLRGDDYGTVTGRFSSSNPNLQNIPSRDPILGPLVRSVFLPEEGMKWWKFDWSQVEYRLIVHFAALNQCEGVQKAVQRYVNDKTTDFHTLVAELCQIERPAAKNINFGIAYGQGVETLAAALGVSMQAARAILTQYHNDAPFVSELMDDCIREANNKGYVSTLFNRRRHYEMWERKGVRASSNYKQNKDYILLPYGAAVARWGKGNIQRAKTYTGMNAKIQGSAADVMKKAMVDAWEAGIYDVLPVHLTVHDELDGSLPPSKEGADAHKEMQHIMEHCVKLRVPLLSEGGVGPTWGDLE